MRWLSPDAQSTLLLAYVGEVVAHARRACFMELGGGLGQEYRTTRAVGLGEET